MSLIHSLTTGRSIRSLLPLLSCVVLALSACSQPDAAAPVYEPDDPSVSAEKLRPLLESMAQNGNPGPQFGDIASGINYIGDEQVKESMLAKFMDMTKAKDNAARKKIGQEMLDELNAYVDGAAAPAAE